MTEHDIEHEFEAKLNWLDEAKRSGKLDLDEYEIELDRLEEWVEKEYNKAGLKVVKEKMHTNG